MASLTGYKECHPRNEGEGETGSVGRRHAEMAVRCEWRRAAGLS